MPYTQKCASAIYYTKLYFRPDFRDNIIDLINSNADKETWKNNLLGELQSLAAFPDNTGWVDRIERTVDLYCDGKY